MVFSLLCLLGPERVATNVVLGQRFLLLYVSRFLTPNDKIKRIDDLVR